MNSLKNLTNIERGKFLADLFPEQLENMVDAIEYACADVLAHEKIYRAKWNGKIFTFDMWLILAKEIGNIIRSKRDVLYRNKKAFAEQLFYSQRFAFSQMAVKTYVQNADTDPFLKLAAILVFCEHWQLADFFQWNDKQPPHEDWEIQR